MNHQANKWLLLFFIFCYFAHVTRAFQNNSAQNNHLVSFIVPCYNRAHTIREALDSIYQQELLEHFEVVCVDDASTDNTIGILQEYADKYSNFRFYIHAINGGASQARNTAITHAHGDLLFTLDSDNRLEPNSVHLLVELLDKTGADIAAFQEVRFFKSNDETYSHSCWCCPQKNSMPFLLYLWDIMPNNLLPIASGNYLFTRQSWLDAGMYQQYALETLDFGFRQLAQGCSIAILPGHYYLHRQGNDSKWERDQQSGRNQISALTILKNNQELFTDQSIARLSGYNTQTHDILGDMHMGYFKLLPRDALELLFKARRAEKMGDLDTAFRYYQEIIKQKKSNKKIRLRFAQLHTLMRKKRQRRIYEK